MDFVELVRTRASIRAYREDPIDRDEINRCIEAARLAPSASNSQPWRFLVVDEAPVVETVARATRLAASKMNRFVTQAPAIVVLALDKPAVHVRVGARIKGIDYSLIDAGIAAEHFCLRAAELGLGTCMIGWFDARRIARTLSIPASKRVVLLITVGYPASGTVRTKQRKPIDEIRAYNAWTL